MIIRMFVDSKLWDAWEAGTVPLKLLIRTKDKPSAAVKEKLVEAERNHPGYEAVAWVPARRPTIKIMLVKTEIKKK